ncbi:DsrE family protein [Flavobacterium sp. MFBS3-15]|uniref:DsrE family protein n=1 Tax=Flavobacterium sp. MFBS3-15 TaxID=2989816 RepID=UPI002235838E|nr:DsrE family protein [Flavobacterium sp. MFBS3-15]MCW4468908.1 DsrE family protein [Flavobacterium sp. MFBS3-15]
MKKFIIVLIILASSVKAIGQEQVKEKHRVVFQMTTANEDEQKGLIRNITHLVEGWGDTFEAEVVAHGPGISFVTTGSVVAKEIGSLAAKGIVFVACESTMEQKQIKPSELLRGVSTVPMGIAEIVLKQEQGWSYIKSNF